MAKLIANECANCHRPVGYVAEGTLQLPTLCLLCVGDPEVLKEWGHRVARGEKPVVDVLLDYRRTLDHMELKRR